jgi:hypothetical protein
LDGWSSEKNYSYWNFIIMTPERHEYLYQLCDFSEESHTGEFLAEKIKNILEEIGSNRFSAIVTDNGANVRLARDKIVQSYPHIFNIRCIAHAINLVSQDIIKHEFAERLIRRCNILITFFKTSHQAG